MIILHFTRGATKLIFSFFMPQRTLSKIYATQASVNALGDADDDQDVFR